MPYPAHPRRYSRGYLPHTDGSELIQFVTFRLHDSLPASVLEKWQRELENEADDDREHLLRERIERYLDMGYGKCWLGSPEVAKIVQDALLFHDRKKYELYAWVVMPNHGHVLYKPINGHSLAEIQHSIKSYTSSAINKLLGRKGQFWQKEAFDRYIRDGRHFSNTVAYIENNPVKARLCKSPEDWPFSSAFHKELRHG
jgi:REP element-mobilizing transposase RayT